MSAPVLSLTGIVARIEAAGIYRSVGGGRDLRRAAQTGAMGGPLAFVLPMEETSRPSGVAGGVSHAAVAARFMVLSLAEDLARDAGGRAVSRIEEVRASLLAALAGFKPDFAEGPVTHERGRLVTQPLPGGLIGWQDEFSLRFRRSLIAGG
ncbi:phage tail terminator protein [Roseovarius autotrophicus]|uniref:phage tail terminator protein n=1 Tax=Roseovarius autotrophicus TaxID=2824121 RepID=UPI0019FDE217|nr:hypothetical protein [Roseovarius autotrophicus]MBE0455720.1 hypothetical protein [Roseovarius sp.]